MSQLNRESEIINLAAGLKVDWQQNAVNSILTLCHDKLSNWLKGRPAVKSISELEKLVCEKVQLVIEEVWSTDELMALIRKYVQKGEAIFATLSQDLDEQTFATLIERRKINANSRDRYVAVVDCRGAKAARRFFTRWHEISHILTLQGQLQLPLHRSTAKKSPVERLMDLIAGEIGFYEPIFNPILAEEVTKAGSLTFTAVESIRQRFCPEASFQATLNACAGRLGSPALVLEVGLGFKKKEREMIESKQQDLIPLAPPKPKLRVLTAVANKWSAGTNLKIHRNMQVPASSLLYKLHLGSEPEATADIDGMETLGTWRHSDGTGLVNVKVRIQARHAGNSTIALMLLVK